MRPAIWLHEKGRAGILTDRIRLALETVPLAPHDRAAVIVGAARIELESFAGGFELKTFVEFTGSRSGLV